MTLDIDTPSLDDLSVEEFPSTELAPQKEPLGEGSEPIALDDGETASEAPTPAPESEDPFIDYEALEKEDLEALKEEFPHLRSLHSVIELDNPERYAKLRDLGLSAREAYLATTNPKKEKPVTYDNRSHLHSTVPKSHGGRVDAMSIGELHEARELFAGMSDSEIIRLYKKVNS